MLGAASHNLGRGDRALRSVARVPPWLRIAGSFLFTILISAGGGAEESGAVGIPQQASAAALDAEASSADPGTRPTMSPLRFAGGVTIGCLLLGLGMGVGFFLSRRPRVRRGEAEHRQLLHMSKGLLQWTNLVAHDVATFQQALDQVASVRDDERGESPVAAAPLVTETFLTQLRDANLQLQRRLSQAEAALQHKADEVEAYISEARTDALTQLPNRRVFNEELTRRFAEWKRHGTPLSVLLFDIDRFKVFNDNFGHPAGDAVLRSVGSVLQHALRETDLVTRFGGEEFAAVLPHCDAITASHTAERVRRAIAQASFGYDADVLHVTVSCGAAQALFGEDCESLIKRADRALYAAKEAGRNCSFWHDGERWLPITLLLTEGGRMLDARQPAETSVALSPDFANICRDLRKRLDEVLATESELSAITRI